MDVWVGVWPPPEKCETLGLTYVNNKKYIYLYMNIYGCVASAGEVQDPRSNLSYIISTCL